MAPEDARRRSILLVEDEALIALSEKNELERYGYAVTHVSGGEDAVRAALEEGAGFDLILMDINLGAGMDGTRAAAEILKRRDIPVVFLSSYMEREVVEKTEGITSYGYVVKNTGITVLDAAIKMALKLHAANRALRESEERLRFMAENMDDIVWTVDRDLGITYISPSISKVLGMRPEERANQSLHEMMTPASYRQVVTLVADELRRDREPGVDPDRLIVLDLELLHADGHIVLMENRVKVMRDADGAIVGFYGSSRDITERKRAEEALRESEQRYRALYENLRDGSAAVDTEGRIIQCNQRFLDMLGYTFDEVKALTYEDITPARWHAMEAGILTKQVVPRGYSELYEKEYIHKDKRVFPVELQTYLAKDAAGNPAGYWAFVRDISERKRVEETLGRSEEQYRSILEAIEDGYYEVDLAGNLTFFNDSLCRMLGYPRDELMGMNNRHYTDGENLRKLYRAFNQVYKTGKPLSDFDWEVIRKDGTPGTGQASISLIRDWAGAPCGFRGIARDITERKRAEEEIQKQLSEKETLLKEVHHRIKNNIASMSSLLNLSADSAGGEARAALLDARGRVESMGKLYERLLLAGDYSSLSVKAYLEELVAAIVELSPTWERPVVALAVEDVELDVKKLFPLGLVVNELVTNALKYAFADGSEGRVEVSLSRRATTVTLMVSDNGKGLPEGFDPAKSGGFGITLVGMLAKQLGGAFTMESANGTRFVLEFQAE